jgi:RNA polymerase sigma-70 factor, ECF subfamily
MALRPTSRWLPRVVRGQADRADMIGTEALTYLNNLYSLALKLTRNPATAEDLVQDTYLKAVRFAPSFRPGTNVKAWLFTILHNTFRNDIRGAVRNPVEADSDVLEAAAPAAPDANPERQLLQSVMDADLQAALDALPLSYREAVWLRDVEECTYQEIADMVGIPLGTVMSRIARGRRLLHDHLVAVRQQAESARPSLVSRSPGAPALAGAVTGSAASHDPAGQESRSGPLTQSGRIRP